VSEEHELRELERRLDHAFQASRPRRGFEDELWMRLRRRSRWWAWEAVAPLGAAAAAFLVVVVAVGAFLSLAGHRGTAGSAFAPAVSRPASGRSGEALAPAEASAGVFGKLPRAPVLRPSPPAHLVVQPAVPIPSSVVVERYREPASLPNGASGTDAALGLEPRRVLGTLGPAPPPGAAPMDSARQAADAYVAANHLQPPQPDRVDVTGSRVTYVRQVAGADEVTLAGNLQGLIVDVDASGTVVGASVPLDLALETGTYAPASIEQVHSELTSISTSARGAPALVLTSVRLVYVVAFDGSYGYLEPAWMFSDGGGRPRVIIPAVADSQLR
jgi:hypothetical protein